MNATEQALRSMTDKQARRYAMYINGEKLVDIAKKEGVSQPAITQCLKYAKKRAIRRNKIL